MKKKLPQTSTKEKKKELVYILTYFFGWLSGIIVYFAYGKENFRIKANAIQAILLSFVSIILAFILSPIGLLINITLWLYGLYVGVKAYYLEDITIPLISNYAREHSGYKPSKTTKLEEKPTKQSRVREKSVSEEIDALKILKMRYAKGEISKKKYNEMKKALE